MIRKDSTSFSWSVSDSASEVRSTSEWSLVLTMYAMSACCSSESSFSFFLPMAVYFWINTEAFVLDLSDAIVGFQERDRYRLDSLLFVNSSYSAKDLALSRMILAL